MPNPAVAIPAAATVIGSTIQSRAVGRAATQQREAAETGIEEQRKQFEQIRELMAPYVQAGVQAIPGFQPFQEAGARAFEQQQALAGLRGPEAQQAAIAEVEQSPFLQAQIRQGEEAMLQRASATGGLRGGNIQAALAQFRPQMLQQAIEQQYGRLGGFAGTGLGVTEALFRGGQAAAAGQASQAGALGQGVAGLLQQAGAARAGGTIGQAAPFVQALNLPMQFAAFQYGRGMPTGSIFGPLQASFSQTGLGSSGFGSGLAYGNQDLGPEFSDRRLKRDIQRIGTRSDGLGVYEFEYVWGGGRRTGLMAQEVREVYPHAVGERAGFLTVDYAAVSANGG